MHSNSEGAGFVCIVTVRGRDLYTYIVTEVGQQETLSDRTEIKYCCSWKYYNVYGCETASA